jgi:hypothetical protein
MATNQKPVAKKKAKIPRNGVGYMDLDKAVKAARTGDTKAVIRHLLALEIQTKYVAGWATSEKDFLEKLLVVSERVESPNPITASGVTKTYAGSLIEKWLIESNVTVTK